MDQKPEVIRERIDATRATLTDKVRTLEQEVRGTVCDVRNGVTDTVDGVRDTVAGVGNAVRSTVDHMRDALQEAGCSLREGLNLQQQVQAHPWVMVGGSVAAGYFLGSLLPEAGTKHAESSMAGEPAHFAGPSPLPARQTAKPRSGFLSGLRAQFAPEIQKVRGLAIGTAIGLLRDLLKPEIPRQLASDLDQLVDSVTIKLGGKPVAGPILSSTEPPRGKSAPAPSETSISPAGSRVGGWRDDLSERRFDY